MQKKKKGGMNTNLEPHERLQGPSCCKHTGGRCPKLVFNSLQEEELAYKEYADLITEIFFLNKKEENIYKLEQNGEIQVN